MYRPHSVPRHPVRGRVRLRAVELPLDAKLAKHGQEHFFPALGVLIPHELTRNAQKLAHSIISSHPIVLLVSAVSLLAGHPVYAWLPRATAGGLTRIIRACH